MPKGLGRKPTHYNEKTTARLEAGYCLHCSNLRGSDGTLRLCRKCAEKMRARSKKVDFATLPIGEQVETRRRNVPLPEFVAWCCLVTEKKDDLLRGA